MPTNINNFKLKWSNVLRPTENKSEKLVLILFNILRLTFHMIRKYHNHTLQIKLQHREEEPQNISNHKTSGIQSKATSSPFPIKMIAKTGSTQSTGQQNMQQTQKPLNGSNGQQSKPIRGWGCD